MMTDAEKPDKTTPPEQSRSRPALPPEGPEASADKVRETGPATAEAETGGREMAGKAKSGKPDPTRYGDWEKGGRCIDF